MIWKVGYLVKTYEGDEEHNYSMAVEADGISIAMATADAMLLTTKKETKGKKWEWSYYEITSIEQVGTLRKLA